jgi:beta-lactam-binding protein with PASTA domain
VSRQKVLDFRFGFDRMSVLSRSFSALGKLAIVGVLLLAFLGGMTGVVYMSLSGTVLKVPEIVGKDYIQSEKELAALGLKIKRRADRVSEEPINTVLEQLPKAGETVKSGQMILVVVSKAGLGGEEPPASLQKDIETDDSEKIEEMISDKPKKKTNSNPNKKKADTTRDVIANETSSNTATDSKEAPDSKPAEGDKKDADKKDPAAGTPPKTQGSPATKPGTEPRSKP